MARKLRMLNINDNREALPPTANSPFIDVVRLPSDGLNGKSIDKISRWAQAINLMSSEQIPQFDLLAIDVMFDRDQSAPIYEGRTRDELPPYGLLIALPLVGMNMNSQFPTAFATYSAYDKRQVRENGVAMTAIGLLAASQRTFPPSGSDLLTMDEVLESSVQEYVVDYNSVPDFLHRLLSQYRANVLRLVESRLIVDVGKAERLKGKLLQKPRAVWSDILLESEIVLSPAAGFSNEDSDVRVCWRSLFADITEFESDQNSALVLDYLQSLSDSNDLREEWADLLCYVADYLFETHHEEGAFKQIVKTALRRFLAQDQLSGVALLVTSEADVRKRIEFMLVICAWCRVVNNKATTGEDYHEVSNGDARFELKIKTDESVGRLFVQPEGKNLSVGDFLASIWTNQFPSLISFCCTKYLERIDWQPKEVPAFANPFL